MLRATAVGLLLLVADVSAAILRAVCSPATRVVERGTGRRVEERRPLTEHLRIVLVWTTVIGSRVLCRSRSFLSYLERMSIRYGEAMDRPATRERIDAFVAEYGVDVDLLDRELREFTTVNEVFSRPLRAGCRPIARADDARVATCPADGRLTCVDLAGTKGRVRIKGRNYDVATLLGVDAEGDERALARVRSFHAQSCRDGWSLAVGRLAPGDYHRVHSPVDGTWCRDHVLDLPGEYHSVAPPCLAGPIDVLGRNRRAVSIIDTDAFGEVAVVVVGAARVGSIEFTASSGALAKGDELARFRYGGSTVAVVFRRGCIAFAPDLLVNSRNAVETLVEFGTELGTATSSRRSA